MVFHRFLAGETSSRRRLTDHAQRRAARAMGSVRPQRAGDTDSSPSSGCASSTAARAHAVARAPVRASRARSSSRVAEAHAAAAGPKKWNRQQGLYIYRGDRMIQSGGWNRLRTMDEHSKLARIALDIPAATRGSLPDQRREDAGLAPRGTATAARCPRSGCRDRGPGRIQTPASPGHEWWLGQPSNGSAESRSDGDWTLGRVWPLIAEVLAHELRDHPELLDRVLVSLANARPTDSTEAVSTGA